MKRFVYIVICILLIFGMSACSREEKANTNGIENQKENSITNEEKEVTILMPNYGNDRLAKLLKKFISSQKYSFKDKYGVTVNIEEISVNNRDDYIKKRNTKLYEEDGPALIANLWLGSNESLIEQGIALEIDDEKVPNLKKVCSPLKNGYLVPMGLFGTARIIKKDLLEDMGIAQPKLSWTKKDYIEIRNKWLEENPAYFNPTEYYDLIQSIMYDINILDKENNIVNLNNEDVNGYIKAIREEVFSGKYVLNEDYTYENYYNMFYVRGSNEQKESYTKNIEVNSCFYPWNHYGRNIFNPLSSTEMFKNENALILPDVLDKKVSTWGFIVNKQGKNVDEALLFLNHLLEDEAQVEFAKMIDIFAAPVIENIDEKLEEEMKKRSEESDKEAFVKAVEFKNYVFEELRKGTYEVDDNENNEKQMNVYRKFNNLVFQIVFADEAYSDKETEEALKRLENELNIYLNE